MTAPVTGGAVKLTESLRAFAAHNITVQDVGLRRPTLDDVFLSVTGRSSMATDDPAGQTDDRATQSPEQENPREMELV